MKFADLFVGPASLVMQGRALGTAHRSVDSAVERIERLEATLERLSLACRGMWELLREQNDIGEEELFEKVREIDLLDGIADGRLRPEPRTCENCSRVNGHRHAACLFCGHELPASRSVFEAQAALR
jgi:hypothetical protein